MAIHSIFIKRPLFKSIALVSIISVCSPASLLAAGPKVPSSMENPLAIVLVCIMIGLLVAIGILSYVVIGAARFYFENQQKHAGAVASRALSTIGFLLLSSSLFAQTEPAAEAVEKIVDTSVGGLSAGTFYTLVGVIGLEIVILIILIIFLRTFFAKEKVKAISEEVTVPSWRRIWDKLNSFRPLKEEAAITLDHNYDGIQELDNKLPPWWLYGFYVCIIFAGIYMYRFHVAHSAPSSLQEYEAAVAKAAIEKEEYLRTTASKVDENTVTLLTEGSDLESGKKLFAGNCAACHGPEGQGIVGPNLTDDYWLHKGGIKDVFKTIKYGVPEKGMKAWQDDFSPSQLAQLASYIKSIQGTKPANPKEPQGDLFQEETTVKDSTVVAETK